MDDVKCPICNTKMIITEGDKPEIDEYFFRCSYGHYSEAKLYDGFAHSIGGQHFDAIIEDTPPDEYWKQIDAAIEQYILTHKGELMEIWFENAV